MNWAGRRYDHTEPTPDTNGLLPSVHVEMVIRDEIELAAAVDACEHASSYFVVGPQRCVDLFEQELDRRRGIDRDTIPTVDYTLSTGGES